MSSLICGHCGMGWGFAQDHFDRYGHYPETPDHFHCEDTDGRVADVEAYSAKGAVTLARAAGLQGEVALHRASDGAVLAVDPFGRLTVVFGGW